MDSDRSQKLLAYLYRIVPQRKSANEISKEVFSNAPVNEMLSELLREGYIYQWKNEADDKLTSPLQGDYGITLKGILSFGKFKENKKTDIPAEPSPAAFIKNTAALAESNTEQVQQENISFKRILPAIILIAFAIALVWFFIHIRK